jgi:hypothetical protein
MAKGKLATPRVGRPPGQVHAGASIGALAEAGYMRPAAVEIFTRDVNSVLKVVIRATPSQI